MCLIFKKMYTYKLYIILFNFNVYILQRFSVQNTILKILYNDYMCLLFNY